MVSVFKDSCWKAPRANESLEVIEAVLSSQQFNPPTWTRKAYQDWNIKSQISDKVNRSHDDSLIFFVVKEPKSKKNPVSVEGHKNVQPWGTALIGGLLAWCRMCSLKLVDQSWIKARKKWSSTTVQEQSDLANNLAVLKEFIGAMNVVIDMRLHETSEHLKRYLKHFLDKLNRPLSVNRFILSDSNQNQFYFVQSFKRLILCSDGPENLSLKQGLKGERVYRPVRMRKRGMRKRVHEEEGEWSRESGGCEESIR
jgi:hypothetical protein